MMLYITTSAQKYLNKLISKQKKGTQIRIFINNPGTPYAKCGVCYFFPTINHFNDLIIKFNFFSIYIDKSIKSFIKDTKIDIISNKLGTQLSLKSPNLHNIDDNHQINNKTNSLKDRIDYILKFQINPQLAMHGGSVSIIEVTKNSLAVLQFHGGCNGCSMALYTIKEGIEKTLKKLCPELKGVIDSTQHQRGEHSFY